jgi:tRNA nucleotidyltransferase (CCA-adding enzyme)
MAGLRTLRENLPRLRDPKLRPSQAVAMLDKIDSLAQALLLVTDVDTQVADVLRLYASVWQHTRAELTGADLQAMGLPRGPLYSKILTQLRNARLDGEISTRAEEVALAKRIAGEETGIGY